MGRSEACRPVVANQAKAAPQWRAGRVIANGIGIAYEEMGAERGDVVLLITGLSWQLIHWPDAYCQALASQGLRVIRMDNRDAGLSSVIDGSVRFNLPKSMLARKLGLSVTADYTLQDMADDVRAFMDVMQISAAHVVGVSMGGMIAQILAGRTPDRVRSLTSIMSTTNHPWLPGASPRVLRHILSKPRDHQRETMVRRALRFSEIVGSPKYPTPETQRRALAERAYDRAFRPGGVLRQSHAIVATGSFESLLRRIRAPTQIIHGTADPLIPAAGGQRSGRCIRGARLTLIEGMGHDLPCQLLPQLAELTLSNVACA